MMTIQEALSSYAAMAELTEQMVRTAERSDWEAMVLLEQRRAALVHTLSAQQAPQPAPGAELERMRELIGRMLDADTRIRQLSAAWLAPAAALLKQAS